VNIDYSRGAFGFELPENSVLYVDDVIVMVTR